MSGTRAALWVALSLSLGSTAQQATAASASVNLSIHFAVAPIDLVRPQGIVPSEYHRCMRLKRKLAAIWSDAARKPRVSCRSAAQMPLIVEGSAATGEIIARP